MFSKYSKYLIYYDNYQEVYTRPPGYFDSLVSNIAEFFEKKENISILDIGCGFGDFLASFHKKLGKKARYHGLTIAKHEFNYICQNHPFIKIKIGREQDLSKIFGKTDKFDIIINFHTLSYISQKSQLDVTKQMLLALKEGGLLILGLVDDWIKISSGVKQGGEGCVQFYYSPFIFLELGKSCFPVLSMKESKNNYRIQFWRKSRSKRRSIKGLILTLGYIIRNNLLFVNILSGINNKE